MTAQGRPMSRMHDTRVSHRHSMPSVLPMHPLPRATVPQTTATSIPMAHCSWMAKAGGTFLWRMESVTHVTPAPLTGWARIVM
jgi:hypothetical protein